LVNYKKNQLKNGEVTKISDVFPQDSSDNGFDVQNSGRLILRPVSVQQRIKELNLRARHFAETVLAVQLQDNYDRLAGAAGRYNNGHAISLQVSCVLASFYSSFESTKQGILKGEVSLYH
jgi:hypothetical protein